MTYETEIYKCPLCGNEQQTHGSGRVQCRECGYVLRESDSKTVYYIQ